MHTRRRQNLVYSCPRPRDAWQGVMGRGAHASTVFAFSSNAIMRLRPSPNAVDMACTFVRASHLVTEGGVNVMGGTTGRRQRVSWSADELSLTSYQRL